MSPQPQQASYGLRLLSVLLICLPSSVCCMDCGGPGKKGGKVLWVVSLGGSRLATSDFNSVGRYGAFPCAMLLQVLLLPAQPGKTQYFYFQPCGIQETLARAARGAFFTRFLLSVVAKRVEMCYTELAENCTVLLLFLCQLSAAWLTGPEKHPRRARLWPPPAPCGATRLRVTGTGA